MDLNTTSLCGESVQLYIFLPWVQGVLITLYVVIFVIGIGGNLLVLAVVLGNKHMRTPINIYLLNLSASDIIMCLFSIPMAPTTTFFGHWVFGAALCKILPLGQNMSVHMSTFTLTAIAVDRYRAVFYPFSTRTNSLSKTGVIILSINIFAIIITLPYSLITKIELDKNGNWQCEEVWPQRMQWIYRPLSTFIHNIIQFVIPFTTILICYTRIMLKLRRRALGRLISRTTEQILEDAARTARMNKMLIAMVVIFGICWLPINLLFGFIHLASDPSCWELYYLSFFIVHVIAMSSACYNPIFYGLLNTAFNKTELLPKFCPCVINTATTDRQDDKRQGCRFAGRWALAAVEGMNMEGITSV